MSEDDDATVLPPLSGNDQTTFFTLSPTTAASLYEHTSTIIPLPTNLADATVNVFNATTSFIKKVGHAPSVVSGEDETTILPPSAANESFEASSAVAAPPFNYAIAWTGVSILAFLMVGMLTFLMILDRRMRRYRSNLDTNLESGDQELRQNGLQSPPKAITIRQDDTTDEEAEREEEKRKEKKEKEEAMNLEFARHATPSPGSKRRHDPTIDVMDQMELKHLD